MYLIKVEFLEDEPFTAYLTGSGNLTTGVEAAAILGRNNTRVAYNIAVKKYKDVKITIHKVKVSYDETPIEF